MLLECPPPVDVLRPSSMFLDCIISLYAGLRDHDPLSWISSFSYRWSSPFGDFSPQTALADGDWIPDVLHRCCKSLLSSVFSTQSFTVACGMEVVGVPSPGGGFVQRKMICTCCGGLTFSLVILSLLECIVLMLFGDSSLLPFCTLWTCEGQSCN